MSLSFPNPAFTKAFTKVPARFARAESTFAVAPAPAKLQYYTNNSKRLLTRVF